MRKIVRIPEVLEAMGLRGRSSIYERIYDATMPPPIKNNRIAGWYEHEIETLLSAYAAGKSKDEIREIVRWLKEARKTEAEKLNFNNILPCTVVSVQALS